ncbi:MAG: hypothetical protein JWN76_3326 [Chitinophagaceae bacterium]|nr:hypothetical protein [Chitinophagaceae bacterium]
MENNKYSQLPNESAGADYNPTARNFDRPLDEKGEYEGLEEQNQPVKNNDKPVDKKDEPMDISGTGSNFEESDFVAVPDKE